MTGTRVGISRPLAVSRADRAGTRLRGTAGGHQRADQQRGHRFGQGVQAGQLAEPVDDRVRVAQPQLPAGLLDRRLQSLPLEIRAHPRGPLSGQATQGGTAPEPERCPQSIDPLLGRRTGGRRTGGRRTGERRDQSPEAVQVQAVGVDVEQVPARTADQGLRGRSGLPQRGTYPGQVGVKRAPRLRGKAAAPDAVDEDLDRDHPAGIHQQRGQHRLVLGGTEVDPERPGPQLDRAQHAELHAPSSVARSA